MKYQRNITNFSSSINIICEFLSFSSRIYSREKYPLLSPSPIFFILLLFTLFSVERMVIEFYPSNRRVTQQHACDFARVVCHRDFRQRIDMYICTMRVANSVPLVCMYIICDRTNKIFAMIILITNSLKENDEEKEAREIERLN